ncbi:hypothetical protein D3C87_1369960 [compost metagenome]
MGAGRQQVAHVQGSLALRGDEHGLVAAGMASRRDQPDAGDQVDFTVHGHDEPLGLEDRPVLFPVGVRRADVGVLGLFPFEALHDVLGAREAGAELARFVPVGGPGGVIVVHVAVDHVVDRFGADAAGRQRLQQGGRLFEVEHRDLLRRELGAVARVDQDLGLGRLDEDGVEGQGDEVVLVDGVLPGPDDLGDDAEHGASVELVDAVAEPAEGELTKLHGASSY